MTSTVTVELPEDAANLVGGAHGELGRELLTAAVLRWFEEGKLSQGQAAATLGLSRARFFSLLNHRRISPIQMSVEDLEKDFQRG